MALDHTHRPKTLYLASLERLEAARRAREAKPSDYVLSMYLAGLAVECVLQAISLLHAPKHEARHDLKKWLKVCRASLQDAMSSEGVCEHWNTVVAVWRNSLRYLSEDGLLGYLRSIKRNRGISGGRDAIMKVNADRLLKAAIVVHGKGVVAWNRYRNESSLH